MTTAKPTRDTVFCKQKQYFGVLWSLSFLSVFLQKDDVTDGDRMIIDSILSSDACLSSFGVSRVGCLPSPLHVGPLRNENLLALIGLTDAHIYSLFQQLQKCSTRVLPKSVHIGCHYLYPRVSFIYEQLWDEEREAHYKACVLEAHANKADFYRDLNSGDYLKECGLHSREVFSMKHDDTDQKTQLWHRLIDEYSCCQPDRSHVHELENLPQEIAIGELLMDCVSKVQKTEPSFKLELVVDVGGGNGFMAAVVGEKLKSDSLVIDPFFPGHSIDCCPRLWKDTPEEARVRPSKPRKYTIHRQMALFKDTTWSEDIGTDPSRTAFIAKHLCGSAIDECLRHLEQQKCLPRILVLAPCCFHRCDYDTYISHDFLKDVLGVEDEMSFRSVTRITDWSKSTYQEEHKKKMKNGKHHGKKTMHDLIPCSNGLAYTVEALLNYGRALWLEKHGYVVHRVQYVPSTVTPKNKCIVAVRYSQ